MSKQLIERLSKAGHRGLGTSQLVSLTVDQAKACLSALRAVEATQKVREIQRELCEKFLKENGFSQIQPIGDGESFDNGLVVVDVCEERIVLINDHGDFRHLEINYYALIGVLISYYLIAPDFNHVKEDSENQKP